MSVETERPGYDHARQASQDCQSDPRAGDSRVRGHHPLSVARLCHVSVVDEGGPPRQRDGVADLGDGHRCGRAGRGGDARAHRASKGTTGGRTIPLHPDLQAALVTLQTERGDMATPDRPILFSERGGGLSPATMRLWFHRLYTSLKMDGCSSHSGRRTFITRAARKVSQVGGSLRDVQELAGHTSLAITQRYIEGDTEAKRKLVALL